MFYSGSGQKLNFKEILGSILNFYNKHLNDNVIKTK